MKRSRSTLSSMGVLDVLDRHVDHRPVHFLRSQFAIYDYEDLATLDSPWWCYGAIDAVSEWLANRSRTRAFEWGAGASTMWLDSRVDELTSVEHDSDFADSVRASLAATDTTSVITAKPIKSSHQRAPSGHRDWRGWDFTDYVNIIDSMEGQFDLICIDGRARSHCLQRAVECVSPGGIIVFDNSDRERYQNALANTSLSTETHRGWTPGLPTRSSTSILHLSKTSERGSS